MYETIAGTYAAIALTAFFRPLPERSLTIWQLLSFDLRGSRHDLGWLLGAGALVGVLGIVPPLYVVVAGKVVQQGIYAELMRQEGAFRELARRQQLDL